jgi:hypothetical protein
MHFFSLLIGDQIEVEGASNMLFDTSVKARISGKGLGNGLKAFTHFFCMKACE